MTANTPQFLYMLLIVPSLFGLVLLGEGINKVINEERGGIAFIVFGLTFIVAVILAYLFFSSYLVARYGV